MSNISSLITLKSELSKRKSERLSSSSTKRQYDLYSFVKPETKNIEKPKKLKLDKEDGSSESKTDLEYKKTMENMERKSKLYDKLLSDKEKLSDDNDFLVDFNKKVRQDLKQTEYTNANLPNRAVYADVLNTVNDDLGDEDNINFYTRALNTEIREHGTGYYKFSSDSSKRNEQMEDLKKFQNEIVKEKAQLNKAKEIERGKLQSRLQKIKDKYNVDVCVDDLIPESQIPEDSEEHNEIPSETTEIDNFLSEVRKKSQFKSKREWDRGKKPISFENVKKKLRNLRNEEFAPPSFY